MNNERLRVLLSNAITTLEEHLSFNDESDFIEYLESNLGMTKSELNQL